MDGPYYTDAFKAVVSIVLKYSFIRRFGNFLCFLFKKAFFRSNEMAFDLDLFEQASWRIWKI